MIKDKNFNQDGMAQQLAALSIEDFLNLGNDGLSYIRLVDRRDGGQAYALYGADGSFISSKEDIEALYVTARQNNLTPLVVQ